MVALTESDRWMSATEVGRSLGLNPKQVRKLRDSGKIRTYQLPGCYIKYSRADVEQIAAVIRGEAQP